MNDAVMTDTDVEKQTLMAYLNAEREAALAIVDGLHDDALRTPVVPSGWSPIGLLWHLGGAELYWFQIVLAGRMPRLEGNEGEDGDKGPRTPFLTDEPVAEVIEAYRAQCRRSDDVLATLSLDAAPLGPIDPGMVQLSTSVRTVVLHMIEETARHAGHLDIARELIDGTTGLGPR